MRNDKLGVTLGWCWSYSERSAPLDRNWLRLRGGVWPDEPHHAVGVRLCTNL